MPDQMRFYMKRFGNRGTLDVPSANFLHLHFWANLFFLIFHLRFKELKYQRKKIYRFRYIPKASLLMIQFGDCFNIGKAFQNTETSPNNRNDVLESSSHQRHRGT